MDVQPSPLAILLIENAVMPDEALVGTLSSMTPIAVAAGCVAADDLEEYPIVLAILEVNSAGEKLSVDGCAQKKQNQW